MLAALVLTALSANFAVGQAPALRMDAAVPLGPNGASITYDLQSTPGAMFLVAVDLDGTPGELFAERIALGLSPALTTVQVGLLPAGGVAPGVLSVPALPAVAGVPLFAQGMVISSTVPNGQFRTSNGESAIVHVTAQAIVDRFDDVVQAGFTGDFRSDVLGRLEGGAVTRRLHSTVDPQSVLFGQAIASPFGYHGVREQMVYRPIDLGSPGTPELITAIRWRPHGAPSDETYAQFEMLAVHTDVVPDYSIGPFSGLPTAPASGLSDVFAANYAPGESAIQLFAGSYTVLAADLRADGYLSYPLQQPFAYDGQRSLLLEFQLRPALVVTTQLNGQTVRLMVVSSPNPAARTVARGSAALILEPALTPLGNGDNAMADYQFEFTRVRTVAVSPWRQSPVALPDYQTPSFAAARPLGTELTVEYRGAANTAGSGATAWSLAVDIADGLPALQYRITFVANPVTGQAPSIDTLVVPVQ